MNRIIIFFAIVLAISAKLNAQDYSVSSIPDSLKLNAHVVIREYNQDIELQSQNKAVYKIKKVLTIIDKQGEKMAFLVLPYDKNSSVAVKQITFYDGNGKKIKNIKQSEIIDSPAYSSSELFSESRIRYFSPLNPYYPYTVEYDYELNYKNVISLGCWHPLSEYNVSIQHARLKFSYPEKVKINQKEVNIHINSSIQVKDNITETWEINSLKAIEDEPFDISLTERSPRVYLMPSVLIYDNYEGKADNWKEYGNWIYSLYVGRDNLSDAEKTKVDALLKEIPDTTVRIRTLYKYMQENTRYVAITLGIGGFQPFDAKTVSETGYGDCKALTNYIHTLLKYVGVKSFPALVSSGRYKESIFTDFPNFQQFDHVILCVPLQEDTIWLECTDQKIPFGFLGDFTDDRDVLLITDNGGKFAHTKRYEVTDNIRSSIAKFTIDSIGNATCSINTFYKGLQYDNITDLLSSNYEEQKKWLYSNSSLPSLQIKNFEVKNLMGIIPVATIHESEISKNYCSFTGNYMFLSLNILNAQKSIQKMLKPRFSDIVINRSSTECDTAVFILPKNYRYESLPLPVTINSQFGSFSCSVTASDKGIIYIRRFTLLEGRYIPVYYKDLYDFILAISKADNAKIILTKTS